MWALLCVFFSVACQVPDLPPSIRMPHAVDAGLVSTGLVSPSANAPALVSTAPFDPSCPVQPPDELRAIFVSADRKHPYGPTDCELATQVCVESGCCDKTCNVDVVSKIVSDTGDVGVSQFQPDTADELGIDPTDPRESIMAQADYVVWCRNAWTPDLGGRTHDDIVALSLGCYNWGRGNMFDDQRRNGWLLYIEAKPHLPKTTQRYIEKNTGN